MADDIQPYHADPGIAVILFPLYVAFVATILDKQAVYAAPMTLIPGTHLLENIHNIWVNGVGTNSAPFWRMLLNSFVMAFSITLGKITVSMLSAFAIVWFRFPLRQPLLLDDFYHPDAAG